MQDDEVLTGHLGASPILDEPGITSFSIIRNPLEHFSSLISYSSIGMKDEDKIKIGELLLDEKNLRFPFIPNMQSTFLTSRLIRKKSNKIFPQWTTWTMADIHAEKTPSNIDEVIEFIKVNKINIATIENRQNLVKQILISLNISKTPLNVVIGKRIEEYNNVIENFCFNNKERIIESNMIDFELFTYISNSEKTNTEKQF